MLYFAVGCNIEATVLPEYYKRRVTHRQQISACWRRSSITPNCHNTAALGVHSVSRHLWVAIERNNITRLAVMTSVEYSSALGT